jgi:periplasmic protein CpxP/Spy
MKIQLSRFVLSSVLATGLAFTGAVALAQDSSAPPPDASAQGPGGRMGGRQMNPDAELARMTKRYKLSTDQQNQIKPILTDRQQQMQALRQDSSLSRDDRRTKMQSIHSDSNAKIEAVLNDTQKGKFEQDQQQAQQRRQQRMQQDQGGAGAGTDQSTPPPPPQ